MRIVFLGTPEFAAASLAALIEAGKNVVAVVTATDKYGGRGGKQLLQSAVKKYALSKNLPVLQPKNLKSKKFLDELRAYKPDVQVVVAFRMLPKQVWNLPPLGTINVHGSLLPAYRGAAPIHRAVINGEKETGVTTFFLKQKIDTGNIIDQLPVPISDTETTGDVYNKLMRAGAKLLLRTLNQLEDGSYTQRPQDEELVSEAPKVFREDAQIDWSLPADAKRTATRRIHDFIRGMNPVPGAWTLIDGKVVKILSALPVQHEEFKGSRTAGILLPLGRAASSTGEPGLAVTASDGAIEILEVKPAGKKQQSGKDFRNGLRLENARPL